MKNHETANKYIKDIKQFFCDKDLSSVKLLSKTHDFIKMINLLRKTDGFIKTAKFV